MEQVQIRTDLALEARESVSEKEEHLHGVQVEEEYKEESEIRITRSGVRMGHAFWERQWEPM